MIHNENVVAFSSFIKIISGCIHYISFEVCVMYITMDANILFLFVIINNFFLYFFFFFSLSLFHPFFLSLFFFKDYERITTMYGELLIKAIPLCSAHFKTLRNSIGFKVNSTDPRTILWLVKILLTPLIKIV
jgi:hypothetical protein